MSAFRRRVFLVGLLQRVATERSGGKAAHDRLRDFPDVRVRLVRAMGQGARCRLSRKTGSTDVGSSQGLPATGATNQRATATLRAFPLNACRRRIARSHRWRDGSWVSALDTTLPLPAKGRSSGPEKGPRMPHSGNSENRMI